MKADKNILKGNRHAELNVVKNHKFYAVVDVKVKNEITGETSMKSKVLTAEGTRIQAKQELESLARAMGGKITYFGGFKK